MREQAGRLLADLPEDELLAPAGRRAALAPRHGVDKSGLPFAVVPHASKKDRRSTRNIRMNFLRYQVLARARGRCEFQCAVAGEPTDAHHVLGGADRTALESEYTLAGICEDCHGRCNASPAWAREQGLAWARRMEAGARERMKQGARPQDLADAAGFQNTAELLEARIALAQAQAGRTA